MLPKKRAHLKHGLINARIRHIEKNFGTFFSFVVSKNCTAPCKLGIIGKIKAGRSDFTSRQGEREDRRFWKAVLIIRHIVE